MDDKGGPGCGGTWISHTYTTTGEKTITCSVKNPETGESVVGTTSVTPVVFSGTDIYFDDSHAGANDGSATDPFQTWSDLLNGTPGGGLLDHEPGSNSDTAVQVHIRRGQVLNATSTLGLADYDSGNSRLIFRGDWAPEAGDEDKEWGDLKGAPFSIGTSTSGVGGEVTLWRLRTVGNQHEPYDKIDVPGTVSLGHGASGQRKNIVFMNIKALGKLISAGGNARALAPTGDSTWGESPNRQFAFHLVKNHSSFGNYMFGFFYHFTLMSMIGCDVLGQGIAAGAGEHMMRMMGCESWCLWGNRMGNHDIKGAGSTIKFMGFESKSDGNIANYRGSPSQGTWWCGNSFYLCGTGNPIEIAGTAGQANAERGWNRYLIIENNDHLPNYYYGTSGASSTAGSAFYKIQAADNIVLRNNRFMVDPDPIGGYNVDTVTVFGFANRHGQPAHRPSVSAPGDVPSVIFSSPSGTDQYGTAVLSDGSNWATDHDFAAHGIVDISGSSVGMNGAWFFLWDPLNPDTLRIFPDGAQWEDYVVNGPGDVADDTDTTATMTSDLVEPGRPHNLWVYGNSVYSLDGGQFHHRLITLGNQDGVGSSFALKEDPLTGDFRVYANAGHREDATNGPSSRLVDMNSLSEDIVGDGTRTVNGRQMFTHGYNIWSLGTGGSETNWIENNAGSDITAPSLSNSSRSDPQFINPALGEQRITLASAAPASWEAGDTIIGLESMGIGRIKTDPGVGTTLDIQYVHSNAAFKDGMDTGSVIRESGQPLNLYNKNRGSHASVSSDPGSVGAIRDVVGGGAGYSGEDFTVDAAGSAFQAGPSWSVTDFGPLFRDMINQPRPGAFSTSGNMTIGAEEPATTTASPGSVSVGGKAAMKRLVASCSAGSVSVSGASVGRKVRRTSGVGLAEVAGVAASTSSLRVAGVGLVSVVGSVPAASLIAPAGSGSVDVVGVAASTAGDVIAVAQVDSVSVVGVTARGRTRGRIWPWVLQSNKTPRYRGVNDGTERRVRKTRALRRWR